MKIVIFIIVEPARVESTSRMKCSTRSVSPRRQPHNVDVHHTLAGSTQIDFVRWLTERQFTHLKERPSGMRRAAGRDLGGDQFHLRAFCMPNLARPAP